MSSLFKPFLSFHEALVHVFQIRFGDGKAIKILPNLMGGKKGKEGLWNPGDLLPR